MNLNQVPINEEFFRQRLQNPPNPVDNRQTFQPNIRQVVNQNKVPIDEEFFGERLQKPPNPADNRPIFHPNSSQVAQNQTFTGASGGTKQKKPPTFDGEGSFRDFLVKFEMISHMCQWNERMVALELAASLRGSAVEVLSDLEGHERCHYPTLVNAPCARAEPQNQSQLYKVQLKEREWAFTGVGIVFSKKSIL